MSSASNAPFLATVRRLSGAAKLNIVGLVVTAAGMLLQMASGSTMFPSATGPIVLLVTALIVTFAPGRWPAVAGLAVPLVLGVGAIVAAVMTGDFVRQLTDSANAGILAGSVMHVAGLCAAIAGGSMLVFGRRAAGDRGR